MVGYRVTAIDPHAVEHDEQRVAVGLDDLAAMLLDRWVYKLAAEAT